MNRTDQPRTQRPWGAVWSGARAGWAGSLALCMAVLLAGAALAHSRGGAHEFAGSARIRPLVDHQGARTAESPANRPPQNQPPDTATLLDRLEERGPAAAPAREQALRALLRSTDPAAHLGLQAWLRRADKDDPDQVRARLLAELATRWRDPVDPVFGGPPGGAGIGAGAGAATPSDPSGPIPTDVSPADAPSPASPATGPSAASPSPASRSGYLPALAVCWSQAGGPTDPAAPLADAARTCLRVMGARQRAAAFQSWCQGELLSTAERAMLLRFAGASADLLLAPWLAEWLPGGGGGPDHPTLEAAASSGLSALVFRQADPIGTAEEYALWAERHAGWTHERLAEHLARRAQEQLLAERAASRGLVERLRADLVRALVQRPMAEVPWGRVQAATLAEGLSADPCLAALAEELTEARHPKETARERHAFHTALLARFDTAGGAGNGNALALRVAAQLLRPDETALREGVEGRLLAALASPDAVRAPWTEILLQALHRFPSAGNRAAVVTLASRILQAMDRPGEDEACQQRLRSALALLRRDQPPEWSWYAPLPEDPDHGAWADLLRGVLGRHGMAVVQRLAVEVARRPTKDGTRHPQAFEVLRYLVSDDGQPVELRTLGRIALQELIATPEQAETFVTLMATLYQDAEPRMRNDAAQATQELPALLQRDPQAVAAWSGMLLDAAAAQLAVERDPQAFSALASVLARCADPDRNLGPSRVVRVLADALRALPREVDGVLDERRSTAVARLTSLAARPEEDRRLELPDLLVVVEALQDGGDQRQLWLVFGANSFRLDGALPDGDRSPAMRLSEAVLNAAVQEADPEIWQTDPSRGDLVLQVWERLRAAGWQPGAATDGDGGDLQRMLAVAEVLAARDRHGEALKLARRVAQGGGGQAPLPAGIQEAAFRQELEALLALKRLEEAVRIYGAGSMAAPDIGERLAGQLLAAGKPALAAGLMESLLTATEGGTVDWYRRWLVLLDARLDADPAARAAVREELAERSAWFATEACPAELEAAFQAIRKKVGKDGS